MLTPEARQFVRAASVSVKWVICWRGDRSEPLGRMCAAGGSTAGMSRSTVLKTARLEAWQGRSFRAACAARLAGAATEYSGGIMADQRRRWHPWPPTTRRQISMRRPSKVLSRRSAHAERVVVTAEYAGSGTAVLYANYAAMLSLWTISENNGDRAFDGRSPLWFIKATMPRQHGGSAKHRAWAASDRNAGFQAVLVANGELLREYGGCDGARRDMRDSRSLASYSGPKAAPGNLGLSGSTGQPSQNLQRLRSLIRG